MGLLRGLIRAHVNVVFLPVTVYVHFLLHHLIIDAVYVIVIATRLAALVRGCLLRAPVDKSAHSCELATVSDAHKIQFFEF